MKVKHKSPLLKSCISEIKDIDEKGIVTFYASISNTQDRVKDIVDPKAWTKTIDENFKEIQHYKNHDNTLMPGVIQELKEDQTGLLVRSKLILGTQLGKETYAEYKAMAEASKSMPHSIGYIPVKEDRDEKGINHIKEMMLFEVSTLTKRPAHPDALTVGIKSLEDFDFEELIKEETFYTNLLKCEFTDAKLENLEKIKTHISALIEKASRNPALDNNKPLTININKFKLS